MAPPDQLPVERAVVAARTSMSEAAFAAVWAEGRLMSLEQSVAYALNEAGHP